MGPNEVWCNMTWFMNHFWRIWLATSFSFAAIFLWSTGTVPEAAAALFLIGQFSIFGWFAAAESMIPMCPTGLGHRQHLEMVTNINGNKFCWHPDCFRASIKDVERP